MDRKAKKDKLLLTSEWYRQVSIPAVQTTVLCDVRTNTTKVLSSYIGNTAIGGNDLVHCARCGAQTPVEHASMRQYNIFCTKPFMLLCKTCSLQA